MDETSFSSGQCAVLDALRNTTESVLITGVAGCGKSTILRHWLAEGSAGSHVVLAPTGIAALNVGGSTIHRTFGFFPNMDMERPRISLKVKSLLYNVDTIVIDEVSMVRADLLSAMDIVLRSIKRKPETPFGGVRMILVGDFYQLPPVVQEEEERWMERTYGSRAGWCFYSPCFRDLKPKVFYLGESFRSKGDAEYTDMLNAIRKLDPNVINRINELAKHGRWAGDNVPRLCARKRDASRWNEAALKAFGVPVTIHPILQGDVAKIPAEAKGPITLAEGARVMIQSNGPGFVNGSLGTLASFDEVAERWAQRGKTMETVKALGIQLDSGAYVRVPREITEVIGYEEDENGKPHKVVLATVEQVRLSLGYAWTIHKSQGQTLESASIDFGSGAFAHGQAYVALSRLTGSAGLYLQHPITKSDMLLDPDVVQFFEPYAV